MFAERSTGEFIMKSRSTAESRSIWQFLKDIVTQWLEDEPFQLASSLSYYTLFSLAPILIIAIAIAGFVFGREAATNQIVHTLQGLVGPDSAKAVQQMVQNASSKPKTGTISTIIGVVALIFGAGGVVGQLQTSLNKIWGVTPKSGRGSDQMFSIAALAHGQAVRVPAGPRLAARRRGCILPVPPARSTVSGDRRCNSLKRMVPGFPRSGSAP